MISETHHQDTNDHDHGDVQVEERIIIEEQLVDHEDDAEHYRLYGPRDHFNPRSRKRQQRHDPRRRTGGSNPIFLIEKIIRNRIFDSAYYKTHCFGLTAETLIEKAIELDSVGGCYGGNNKPAPFLCLLLRMLHIEVDHDIVLEYIHGNEHYKYVTALGAVYLRMTADAAEVYRVLEPLYNDYRKIRMRNRDGSYKIAHVDELVDILLTEDDFCGIKLPFLLKRRVLQDRGLLDGKRKSFFDEFDKEDLEEMLQELEEEQQQQEEEKEERQEERNEDVDVAEERSEDQQEKRVDKEGDGAANRNGHDQRRSRSSSRDRRSGSRERKSDRGQYRMRFKGDDDSPKRRRSHNDRSDGDDDNYRRDRHRGDDRHYDSNDRYREDRKRRKYSHREHERYARDRSYDDDRSARRRRSDRGDDRRNDGRGSGGGEIALSVEETNKLRKQLGLAPLKQ